MLKTLKTSSKLLCGAFINQSNINCLKCQKYIGSILRTSIKNIPCHVNFIALRGVSTGSYQYCTSEHIPISTIDENRNQLSVDTSDILDEEIELNEYESPSERINVLQPLENSESINVFTPQPRATFNLASYADDCEVLRQFVALGAEVALWEKDVDLCNSIIKLDFEKDIKPYVFFLNDLGILPDELGRWFTINPYILKESLTNLEVRKNYLEVKKFTKENIAMIFNKVPKWLNVSVFDIDAELGKLQKRFQLSGKEVRYIATKDPKLIMHLIKKNFHMGVACIIFNEFGFEDHETKKLLLSSPRLFRTHSDHLRRRIDVLHNKVGISHEAIIHFPSVLLMRERKMLDRSEFLAAIGKNQFNPKKPNYVTLKSFCEGTDDEFCKDVGKCEYKLYNDFLKTL